MAVQLDPAAEYFLNSIRRLQSQLETVQRRVSSGVAVEKPSDAPRQIVDIVRREAQTAELTQTRFGLGRVGAEVDAAEASLRQAVRVIEQAIVVGSQAASNSIDSPERQAALQTETDGLLDELVRLSLTQSEGRYVFGGDADQQPPYEIDKGNATGVNRLSTAPSTRLAVDYDGSRFLTGRAAQQIFDSRDGSDNPDQNNAFAALADLRAAIAAGDSDLARGALERLESSHDHLNQQLSFYGGVQRRIDNSVQQARSVEVRLTSELSELRDTDIAKSAVELARLEASLQAAMSARAAFTTQSLFDFLR